MKTLDNLLLSAISKDQVKFAYLLLKLGANANQKVIYTYRSYKNDGLSIQDEYVAIITESKSPLDSATSEAMKKLLKHFGGLQTEDAKKIWEEQETLKIELEKKKADRKKKRLDLKHKKDQRFVDRLTK